MEKMVLRQKALSVQPEAPEASRVFTFWLRTIEDFIAAYRDYRKEGEPEINKKRLIISRLSPDVFSFVEEAGDYERIVETLKSVYVKNNNVYERHLLVRRRQIPTESISEFLQSLKSLAKECSFADVLAAVYREVLTRDSFINNLSSSSIRQRLLEKDNLTLVQAYELADNVDRAQRQSQHINQVVGQTTTAASTAPLARPNGDSDSSLDDLSVATARTQFSSLHSKEALSQSCSYCSLNQHKRRSMCPAREAMCHACGKRSHY